MNILMTITFSLLFLGGFYLIYKLGKRNPHPGYVVKVRFSEHGYEVRYDGNAYYHHVLDEKLYNDFINTKHMEVLEAQAKREQEAIDEDLGPQ